MKINKYGLVLIACSLLILNSCGIFQKNKKEKPQELPANTQNKSVIIPQKSALDYLQNTIQYNTFDAVVSANYKDASQEHNGDVVMKSIYGNQSSLSIRAGMMGINAEIATVLANVDSIFALNKFQVTYYQYSFTEASKIIKAPIDFIAFQNLLVGNPLVTGGKIKQFINEESNVLIALEKDNWVQTLLYEPATMDLKKIMLVNKNEKFECSILLSEYESYNANIRFAKKRDIKIKNDNKVMDISLYYQKYNFNNPIEIKFNIPKTYRSGNNN